MDIGREGRRDSEGKEADPGGGNERGQSSARGGTAVFNANDKLVVRLSSH